MLSNKLTFSLASLIVLLAFAFSAMPVMAHDGDATHDGDTTGHIQVKSITLDRDYLTDTPLERVVATITFELEKDAVTTAGSEAHAIVAPAVNVITVTAMGVKPDGTAVTSGVTVGTVTQITAPTATVNGVFAVTITRADATEDGVYTVVVGSVTEADIDYYGNVTPAAQRKTFVVDSADPVVAFTQKLAPGGKFEEGTTANPLTGPFIVVVTLTGEANPPSTVTIKPTPASATVGTVTRTASNMYEALITPDLSMTSLMLTVTASDKAGNMASIATTMKSYVVKKSEAPKVTVGDGAIKFSLTEDHVVYGHYVVITTADSAAEIVDPATTVTAPAKPGYSVIEALNYDLEDFFLFGGGSIELIGPAGTQTSDIVISEIMWGGDQLPEGEDEAAQNANRMKSQWIELYVAAGDTTAKDVTTATPAKLGEWMLNFTRNALITPATDSSDVMSNRGLGRWSVTNGSYGQGGNKAQRANALQGLAAVTAEPYISMYRNINHVDLVKTDKTRADQLKAIPDGTRSGSWQESSEDRGKYQNGFRYATPGESHVTGVIEEGPQSLARADVVFNEIANRTNKKNDWIELYNGGTAAKKINGWALSSVTNNATDTTLFVFESDEDITIPSKGYLIVVNTDPANTDLAAGENVTDRSPKARGVQTRYYVNSALDIPKEDFLLVLRTEKKEKSHEKIVDIAGNDGSFALNNADYATDVWPLKSHPALPADDIVEDDTMSWVRDQSKPLTDGDAWKKAGYTGLGYDRNATINSGSPGYANDALKAVRIDADGKTQYTGTVSISEIMVESNNGRAPQWIEIYNNSATQAVNLENWVLVIQNYNSQGLDGNLNTDLKLDALIVPPNQTVLIVSSTSSRVSSGKVFGDGYLERQVYSLFDNHADDLGMENRRDTVISEKGFYIELRTPRPDYKVHDSIGNLDNDKKTRDEPSWALPEAGTDRASLVRRYTGDGDPDDGTTAEGWKSAALIPVFDSDGTYYGDPDDLGSPGWRTGGPLPVSLSSFRPARDTATGAVVIRWNTESELDNAGFNILRSETKRGEFKVVNLKGIIPGHGTTSEKHTYTWTDTTAKPNVVYYYQIEDVSLDGKRTTLATTHLRGNVTAAGKATTTWADLKTLRK